MAEAQQTSSELKDQSDARKFPTEITLEATFQEALKKSIAAFEAYEGEIPENVKKVTEATAEQIAVSASNRGPLRRCEPWILTP